MPSSIEQAKAKAKEEKQQTAASARRREVRANRTSFGIDNKKLSTASDEKYSNCAANTAHPHGGNKARVLAARTGLSPVDVFKQGDPSVAMNAANRNPTHLAELADNMGRILSETRAGKAAERKPGSAFSARMDIKHKFLGPTGAKTVRVQMALYRLNRFTGPHPATGTKECSKI